MYRTFAVLLAALVALPAIADTQTYDISPSVGGSQVRFTSDAPLEMIQGETTHVKGRISVDPDTLAEGKGLKDIEFKVNLASLDTGIPLRNEHMRNSYLETAKYPDAVFKVEKLTPLFKGKLESGHVASFKAEGPFTLHGKTIRKTIPVSVIHQADGKIRIQSHFPVSLSEYGIPRPEIVNQKLAETIYVNLDLTGTEMVGDTGFTPSKNTRVEHSTTIRSKAERN